NVTGGFDAAPRWMLTHRQVMRAGWAWVGVSAQRAGVEGGSIFEEAGEDPDLGSRRAMVLPALKEGDPVRYRALPHSGDAFCFAIFTQAARAVRGGGVLGPFPVECLLAAGQSQSAIHLVSYVNAVAPIVAPEAACDGYLIGSRTGFAAPLTGWDGRIRSEGPDGARVRTDGRAPPGRPGLGADGETRRRRARLAGGGAGRAARQQPFPVVGDRWRRPRRPLHARCRLQRFRSPAARRAGPAAGADRRAARHSLP